METVADAVADGEPAFVPDDVERRGETRFVAEFIERDQAGTLRMTRDEIEAVFRKVSDAGLQKILDTAEALEHAQHNPDAR